MAMPEKEQYSSSRTRIREEGKECKLNKGGSIPTAHKHTQSRIPFGVNFHFVFRSNLPLDTIDWINGMSMATLKNGLFAFVGCRQSFRFGTDYYVVVVCSAKVMRLFFGWLFHLFIIIV